MKVYWSLKDIPPLTQDSSLAIGVFDGMHLGHKAIIRTALKKAQNTELQTAVLTFRLTEQSRPATKEADKRIMSTTLYLRQLKNMGVSVVFFPTFEEIRNLSPADFVTQVLRDTFRAKFIVTGDDFRFGRERAGTTEMLVQLGSEEGIAVETLPLVEVDGTVVSSTAIREHLVAGDIAAANRMLGHLYAIDFTVVHGNHIGRTIGSPTINQPYPESFVVPKFGVYASLTYIDEKIYTSVTSIGIKPTIVGNYSPLAETYIQGYKGDLYGQNVQVGLLEFLRPEIKYDTLDQLREQIEKDSKQAAELGMAYLHSK